MMGGYGFAMMGYGLLGWMLNLLVTGVIVFAAVRLALRKDKK